MNKQKLQESLELAIESAREVGQKLVKHYGNVEIEAKSDSGNVARDIVTELDRQTETFLSEKFKEFDPTIGFRGEEFGVENHANTTWLVDPIDGTNHFVRGLPFCTTMIALVENGTVILAVIHDFVRGETYWATKGGGAFKDGEPIHVSTRPLDQAVLSIETKIDKPENTELYLKIKKRLGGTIETVNCGFEFAMIASGKIDGKVTKDPYGFDWDYAAGTLLVEEAGGIVRNHGRADYDFTNHDFIAANPAVYEALTTGAEAIFPIEGQVDADN